MFDSENLYQSVGKYSSSVNGCKLGCYSVSVVLNSWQVGKVMMFLQFFPGHESRATEALCWAEGQRLFSAGLNGEILEYDLQALNIKYSLDAFGGPIWSMTASPSGSQLLVSKQLLVIPNRVVLCPLKCPSSCLCLIEIPSLARYQDS